MTPMEKSQSNPCIFAMIGCSLCLVSRGKGIQNSTEQASWIEEEQETPRCLEGNDKSDAQDYQGRTYPTYLSSCDCASLFRGT